MRRPAPRRFESLEPRLALAGLVTFMDSDGDTVTVQTNRGTTAQLAAALTLAPSGIAGGSQLRRVALAGPAFAGTNLTITARPSASGGNGQVDVGEIDTALDLGRVTVGGDLGRIIVGNANRATPGMAAFTVTSIGERGTVTGAPDFVSRVNGPVPTIRVAGNLVASFYVFGRAADVVIGRSIAGVVADDGFSATSIGRMVVGGSVIGGAANNSGKVAAGAGGIGRLVIQGNVVGGSGAFSGSLGSTGRIGFARIGGSLFGGAAANSGTFVVGSGGIGRLVVGNIFGGSVANTGLVQAYGPVGSIAVGGSIGGEAGDFSGAIYAPAGVGTIDIANKLSGGTGTSSGVVIATRIGTLRVGKILAGDGPQSGSVRAVTLGTVVVRSDMLGSALQPAIISATGAATPTGPRAIGSLTVGGSLNKALVLGGYDPFGLTATNGAARIGAVTVRGDLIGSSVVAGVMNIGVPHPVSGMPQFGDGLDMLVPGRRGSRIESLVVNGVAVGAGDLADYSGVLATSIGSVRIGGRPYTVTRAGITPTPTSPNLQFRLIV